MKKLTGIFSCNSVIWFTSLPAQDQGTSRRVFEDVEPEIRQAEMRCEHHSIQSAKQLFNRLEALTSAATEIGLRPLLHFDMHGNAELGLHISASDEYIPWTTLADHLGALNVATGNNLCVVGAACYGLKAISSMSLERPTPFFLLLAPEEEVSMGFLEDNIPAFYRELFISGVLIPYERYLEPHFSYFHCERVLFEAIARYIQKGCKGKSGKERRERLLTEMFMTGIPNTKQNRRVMRRQIKAKLKPGPEILDRYARTFLAGKPCSFDFDELLSFVQARNANPDPISQLGPN